MTFMILVLIITIILVPVCLYLIRWLYKKWCLSAQDRFKSEEFAWYIEISVKFLALDILILLCDATFIIELLRS